MIGTACQIAMAATSVAILLNLYCMALGPDVTDRILALDTLYVNSATMLVLYGLQLGTGRDYEAALLIAMLGFITTVVLSKFLTRGDVIE